MHVLSMYVVSLSLSFTVIPSLFHIHYNNNNYYTIAKVSIDKHTIHRRNTCMYTCVITTIIAQRKHTVVIFHQQLTIHF